MACRRGRAAPNTATKFKLFADSAGFCQNPDCTRELFPTDRDDHPHLAEIAHIFAATDGGPRTNASLSEEERGNYNNLILLCANCHTLVDKTPDQHTAELMVSWKARHCAKRRQAFGVQTLSSRKDLRAVIQPLLGENATVHAEVGPDNEYRLNPEAAEARVWKRRVKTTIIPNSLKVLEWLDLNSYLLNEQEIKTKDRFRYHVEGLILRHLEGEQLPNAFFPVEMNGMAD